jgi:hypothetical protein
VTRAGFPSPHTQVSNRLRHVPASSYRAAPLRQTRHKAGRCARLRLSALASFAALTLDTGTDDAMVERKQVQDGQWVRPVMTGYEMECCGCGMVHTIDFRVTPERGLEMRGYRQRDTNDAT